MAPLPCVECGYDLSGLSPRGVCPECGAAVSRTLGAALLGATRGYRAKVRWGAMTLLIAVQLMVLPLLGSVARFPRHGFQPRVLYASVVGLMLLFPACWLLTSRAPEAIEARVGRFRGGARVCSFGVLIMACLTLAALEGEIDAGVAFGVAELIVVGGLLLAWVSVFDAVALIAAAAGDAAIRRRADRCGWWPIGVLLAFPLGVIAVFAGKQLGVRAEVMIGGVAIVVLTALWVDSSVVLARFWRRVGSSRAG